MSRAAFEALLRCIPHMQVSYPAGSYATQWVSREMARVQTWMVVLAPPSTKGVPKLESVFAGNPLLDALRVSSPTPPVTPALDLSLDLPPLPVAPASAQQMPLLSVRDALGDARAEALRHLRGHSAQPRSKQKRADPESSPFRGKSPRKKGASYRESAPHGANFRCADLVRMLSKALVKAAEAVDVLRCQMAKRGSVVLSPNKKRGIRDQCNNGERLTG